MDSAFKSAPFSGYTTVELEAKLEFDEIVVDPMRPETRRAMEAEIERRAKVAAGDRSAMTPGERLRFASKGKAK